MNNIEHDYLKLLKDILDNGVEKKDRTGTGTCSVFGRQIRHKMSEGFPLLTTKKMPFKTIVTELLWFMNGRTDLRYLLENNCHIWTGDAYKVYDKDFDAEHPPFSTPYPKRLTQKEFEEKIMADDEFNKWYGDLGPIYGAQWRNWNSEIPFGEATSSLDKGIDQIQNLINDLKTNPDSRRLMVSAWNVGELDQMVLPPCHYGFQCYVREGKYLSLMWNQRSVDTFLGLPFNIASYALLLEIIAKEVNMIPDELIGNLGDVHLYNNHIEQAKEQITRTPFELPKLNINTEFWPTESGSCGEGPLDATAVFNSFKDDNFCKCLLEEDIQLYDYQSHPSIKAPLSN